MSPSWTTVDVSRRVLAVARTTTSYNRILDVLPALADDPRVQVVFTIDEGSEFSIGVADHIRAMDARIIPWSTAREMSFDLVIAASDNSDLHELAGPKLLVPHGAGHQKYSAHSDPAAGAARELSGLSISALWHDGSPVPARIGLSHGNQLAQLKLAAPGLVDRAAVIGDPCLDRLSALARDRGRQRRLLGVQPWHSLVAVTSTWGAGSSIGRWPTLPADLVAQLPYDEFRVAAVLHPNIWAQHSGWQIRHWLNRARAAGLILVPPTGPWQSALAAADCVVGDHGSLSAYTTGLRRPLVLAAFDATEVPAGTAMSELGALMPRLVREQPLAEQIRRTIATVDRVQLDRLADMVFAHRDESLDLLQDLMYELMSLAPPALRPMPSAATAEPPMILRPRAFRVSTEFDGDAVTMRRLPATLSEPAVPKGNSHLVVTEGEPDERLAQNAAVVVADRRMPPDAAHTWCTTELARLPGCRIAVAPLTDSTIFAALRDGRTVCAATDPAHQWEPELLGSALYGRIVRDRGRTDLRSVTVTVGDRTATIAFRLA